MISIALAALLALAVWSPSAQASKRSKLKTELGAVLNGAYGDRVGGCFIGPGQTAAQLRDKLKAARPRKKFGLYTYDPISYPSTETVPKGKILIVSNREPGSLCDSLIVMKRFKDKKTGDAWLAIGSSELQEPSPPEISYEFDNLEELSKTHSLFVGLNKANTPMIKVSMYSSQQGGCFMKANQSPTELISLVVAADPSLSGKLKGYKKAKSAVEKLPRGKVGVIKQGSDCQHITFVFKGVGKDYFSLRVKSGGGVVVYMYHRGKPGRERMEF